MGNADESWGDLECSSSMHKPSRYNTAKNKTKQEQINAIAIEEILGLQEGSSRRV